MRLVRASLPLVLASAASTVSAQGFTTELVAVIPQRPITISSSPSDPARILTANKLGRFYLIKNDNFAGQFMDMSSLVDDDGEGGLLGIALHPDYASNGRFYVSYTTGVGNGDSVLSQFTRSSTNPDQGDVTSEQIIWGPYPQTTSGHKAGDIHFGPDGMLYMALGDGYAGGTGPDNRAQDLMDPRGKILRFDVDAPFPHTPADNPYVGDPNALDEIWAYGLRNPFSFSIDRVTGDLYIADVGQSSWEEIDFIPAGMGGLNFGWRCKEGSACYGGGGCCSLTGATDPMYEYDHNVGCAVIGGKVYRGSAIPALQGRYFFTDFCQDQIWSFRNSGGSVTDFVELTDEFDPMGGGIGSVVAFGEDANGELYLVEHYSGEVWKVVPECSWDNYCSATTNSTGAAASLSVSGSLSLADNSLQLDVVNAPTDRFGYFLMSETRVFVPLFGGSQGNLCLGSPLIRFAANPLDSGPSGEYHFSPDFNALPNQAMFQAGEVWNFQCWFRDQNPGNTSNTTNGASVLICP